MQALSILVAFFVALWWLVGRFIVHLLGIDAIRQWEKGEERIEWKEGDQGNEQSESDKNDQSQ